VSNSVLEESVSQQSIAPAQRLRITMAAVRVSFVWLVNYLAHWMSPDATCPETAAE